MTEYREKSRKKVQDLSEQVQRDSERHRAEMLKLKFIYEEKIKVMDSDIDTK